MTPTPTSNATTPDGRPTADQPKWRRDFPVDIAEDNYVARREFVKFLVLTSGAFAVGQLAIVASALARRGRSAPPALAIARVDQIPVGGVKPFTYPTPEDVCLLVRVDETKFVAYDQRCTHLSCAVVPEPEKHQFYCPCHEGAFDLATGRAIAGPPRRPLTSIALEVRDGLVFATGVEERMS